MALSEYEQGVFYAAAIVIAVHNEPTIAATIIVNAGYQNHDVSDLDDYEKNELKKINNLDGINLQGL